MKNICANCDYVHNESDDEPYTCTLKNKIVKWNQVACESFNNIDWEKIGEQVKEMNEEIDKAMRVSQKTLDSRITI